MSEEMYELPEDDPDETLYDRLEEIAMALGCDLPEECPYESGTIEAGIFQLRRENERRKQIAWELLSMLHTGCAGLGVGDFNRFDRMLRAIAGPEEEESGTKKNK